MKKCRLRKNDEVIVLTGKDKGKKGKVLQVLRQENRVLVSGINLVKKHTKPTQDSEGGIKLLERPIHISNVAYFDSQEQKPSKVSYKQEGDSKIRYCKKSQNPIKDAV